MGIYNQNIDGKYNNKLIEALVEYQNALDRGDYTSLDDNDDIIWSENGGIEIVQDKLLLLLNMSGFEIGQASLKKDLIKNSVELSQILNLLALLDILKNQKEKNANPGEEWRQLKAMGAIVYIEAGLPGPSLLYLNALRNSLIDEEIKLLLIEGIIINAQCNENKFGILDKIVLKVAVNDWLNIVKNSSLRNAEKINSKKIIKSNSSFSDEEIFQKMNSVERYLLIALQRFKIEININIIELSGLSLNNEEFLISSNIHHF